MALGACTSPPPARTRDGSAPATGSPAPGPTHPATEGTIGGLVRSGPLEVPEGRTLRFDPERDTTLEVTGNVVVRGLLEMRPRPGVEHVLRFVGVEESAFVGGGLDPIDTDVGLWVMGAGRLDLRGTPREAWNRTGDSPTWEDGDELVVTPVEPGDTSPRPFRRGDPVPSWGERLAEVLDLTRNVRIEGTAQGRAHVFIRSTSAQTVEHAALRYLGPRQADGAFTTSVLGRYGLHFHHCHDGSQGSLVQGVVVRDCGAHAFVPHMSHGITMRGCVAYEVFDEAYWWDPQEETNDLLIDGCVAVSVHADPEIRGYRLAGFLLGLGRNLELRNSVATAVHGNRSSSGFLWPEAPSGLWTFEDNVAHNNDVAGIFVWQNNREPHRIDRFTAFHNGVAGIVHGAYTNGYHYADLDLRDQPTSIELIAAGRPDVLGRVQSWTDVRAGTLLVSPHFLGGDAPVLFRRCSFAGGVTMNDGEGDAGAIDFVECDLEPADFDLASLHPGTVLRVQRADGTAYAVTTSGARDINPFFAS